MEFNEVKEIKYSFDDNGDITIFVNGIEQKTEYDKETNIYTVDLN